jgi:succinate dehydrogenase / fumarate reductase cytochrome b subunit
MAMKPKPVFLNLWKIHLPIAGWVSIAHRGSGLLLFFAIPGAIYLLNLSLSGEAGFSQALSLLHNPVILLILLILCWGLLHHLLAGIRFLLIDLDYGVDLVSARKSALLVLVGGVILTLFAGLSL